ncbi:MAG: serine hydrolase [Planctomycetes bacterium]|nr:serine hydrolase [Planctomycetota bacterium]
MRRLLPLLALAACASPPPRFDTPRFASFQADLLAYTERLRDDMAVPGVWLAVLEVDPETGAEHLWASHVGQPVNSLPARAAREVLATHRVASISKLFTDTAAMVLVEQGKLDLDADVRTYLPQFAPKNPFGTPVTLRHLMGHRAGVVRESPVGHYFDPDGPSLAATVASLNDTALVAQPGTRFKYSNPGIGVVGRIIEQVTRTPFERAMRQLVLDPLRLDDSDFAERAELVERQAHGVMWTYDGRRIPTPEFRFGYVPAAELRSTVVDLVRFARSWFPDAKRRVLRPDTQASMWQLPAGDHGHCGLGFFVGALDGHLRVSHGGAVYGFASTLTALPEQRVACAVVCTKDCVNRVSSAIANRAMRSVLANRRGKTLAPVRLPKQLGASAARALQGHYVGGGGWFDLLERDGELVYVPRVGVRSRMRRADDGSLVAWDALSIGRSRRLTILPNGALHDGKSEFARDDAPPPAAPAELGELIGEYGWDHNVLVVYEDHQRLGVLIEWVEHAMPVREAKDRYRFAAGMYTADRLLFERDAKGRVCAAVVGGARFPRRGGPTAGTFRMPAVKPVPDLVAAARRQAPPAVLLQGNRPHELVDLRPLDPTLQFEIRYATTDNFLGAKVYAQPIAKMQRPAAEALLRAHRGLAAHGVGLKVFDAYRPWWVTKVFWDAAPRHLKLFVADPMRGSRHNRGCAVDLTLYDRASGAEIPMPSGYDEFTARAYPDYPGGTSRQRHYRELLRRAMQAEGFTVYEHEWWHFDFADWREYPIGNREDR